jgi:hypothetical protein
MRDGGRLPRLAAGLLLWPLAACSTLGGLAGGGEGEVVHVTEIRSEVRCNSDGPQPRLTLLADEAALRAWQQARKVDLIGVDSLPSPGPYALVEMGVRLSAGYGIVVSRQAEVRSDVLRLSASLLTPQAGQAAAQVVSSPCTLVALPPRAYRAAELFDPSGDLLARARASTPLQ